MYHGNFNWGYILGAYLLWFISIRDYAAWRCCFADGRGFKKAVAVLAFALCGIVLLLHLASGIYYLYYLVVLGNGI
jgi:hypothetical protein